MGFDLADMISEQKLAVECGYWPLYRFNGENLTLDSSLNEDKYFDFLRKESRYSLTLNSKNANLLEENKQNAIKNYNKLKNLAKKE